MFRLQGLFCLVCLVGASRIAKLMDGNQKVAQRRLILGPDQAGTLCGVIHRKRYDTSLLLHVIFKQPYTGSAGDAANQQLSFLCAFYWRHEGLLNQGVIQFPQAVHFGVGQLLWRDCRLSPEIVKTGQTLAVNRLANRFAALTAEVMGCAIKLEGNGRLTVSRLTAMEAIQVRQPWADSPALMVMPLSEGSQVSPLRRHSLAGPLRS